MTMQNNSIVASSVSRLLRWRQPGAAVFTQFFSPARRSTDAIATVSHELRNSLGVMKNAAALLRSSASAATIDQARTLIDRHVGHMNRHIEELLGLASGPTGSSHSLQRSHIDLRTIVGHAVSSIAPDMAQRTHRLVVHLPDDAIWVNADAARLEQAFTNLLINAAKYTPDGGEVVVSLDLQGTHARLRIRDSGIGIDAAMLQRVFELYVQGPTAEPHASGSGIGLARVRELVEKHGGTVQAASAGRGRGSEFTVIVPLSWAKRLI
jgi:two-component system CheB/CheR fusion protein